MFILRMIFRSFSRQFRRRLLVAITICLSSAVATAMLGVVFDVGDKLNEELSAYGSNIVIEPKSDAVVADLYETVDGSDTEPTSFLKESDIRKIKTIFWAYNITNFAPKLNLHADITAGTGGDAATVPVVGTWFNTTLHLATGETSVVGVQGMRSWWTINGRWARDDADEAMIGADLADQLHIDAPGMTITLSRGNTAATVTVVGIYDSGDEENGAVYVPSATLQELSGLTDSVDEVEVKALTTPENDLARKVSRNPAAVTQEEWETWYCTAYASSIAYQIEEVLPDAVAKQIRQISELQGDVLNKTRAVMIVMTGLSLLAAAIAVANLMAASITERSSELALLKAIGATDGAVSRLVLLETAVIALIGALAGAGLGVGAAQLIGQVVFASMVGTVTLFGLAAICLTVPQQMGDEMRAYGANLIVTGPQGGMDNDVVRTVETQVRAAAEADAATYRYETVRVNAASYVLAGIDVDATRALNRHWVVDGDWPSDGQVLVGSDAAEAMSLQIGDTVTIGYRADNAGAPGDAGGGTSSEDSSGSVAGQMRDGRVSTDILETDGVGYRVAGILETGGNEDGIIYATVDDIIGCLDSPSRGSVTLEGRRLEDLNAAQLADEPTGNLDERNERIVLDLFRQLHEQGTTIIVVTHDALVASCAQREIMLNHGVLVGERWNDETARLAYEAAGGRPASTGAQVEGAQTGGDGNGVRRPDQGRENRGVSTGGIGATAGDGEPEPRWRAASV